jgi:dipeptidyl aminopeptidase/acylaminoacyl peptidase
MPYSNITKTSGSVSSNEGLPIYYDLYVPNGHPEKQFPVVIFLHGFKGFKDWGAFPDACVELSTAGFAVLAINFSLNGVGKNMLDFDELIDTDFIGLLGHSRGGHTATAAASEYDSVSCLVTWSAVADYNARWSDEMIADWKENGVTEIKNGRTGQIMPVKDVVYKDALENADRLMAVNRAKELSIPALFVHSKGDEAVPYTEAEKLYQSCASEEKRMKLIPDSGHTFDTSHPFEEEEFPEAFQQAVESTIAWFEDHLQ